MSLIDLTHDLASGTMEYPGDPKTEIELVEDGECTLYRLATGLHTGTHMDAPLHYIKSGAKISDLNLEDFIGTANVVRSESETICPADELEEIVIINTDWSKHWGTSKYFMDYPYLSIEFAERIVEENVKGVAIDTCSVDKAGESEIHKLLLKNNVWIVENIANGNRLKGDCYKSYFIPLKIEAEASPVRAFAKKI